MRYYGYRYYDPVAGRWLSRDPIGDEAFFIEYAKSKNAKERVRLRKEAFGNNSAFVYNNPITAVDPYGLSLRSAIDQILEEAGKRRGRGPWTDSAQHCWAACRIGMLHPMAGELAALLEDYGELENRAGDWLRDIIANHAGAACAAAVGPLGGLAPETICDCCCMSH